MMGMSKTRGCLCFYQPLISFEVVDGIFSLEGKMGKRKIDPVTGKCIKNPSDTNRKKRPKKKLRTRDENNARNEAESTKQSQIRYNAMVSVNRQKVQHTDDVLAEIRSTNRSAVGAGHAHPPVVRIHATECTWKPRAAAALADRNRRTFFAETCPDIRMIRKNTREEAGVSATYSLS